MQHRESKPHTGGRQAEARDLRARARSRGWTQHR